MRTNGRAPHERRTLVYESLAKQYPNVQFTKCDVDEAKEVAARYSIRFVFSFFQRSALVR